jgi:hypothetical protein
LPKPSTATLPGGLVWLVLRGFLLASVSNHLTGVKSQA